MKILILGANGQVGTELQRSFAGAGEITACTRAAADLARPQELRTLIRKIGPEIILNAAAYTAVDRAETETDLAMTVNGEAPGVLAEEAAKLNALLVHYSTDYVFNGRKETPWVEDDPTEPLNAYGRSKLAGEEAIRAAGGRYLIFRTSWVYGPHGHNFLLTMLRLGRERDQLRVVDDQFGAPTSSIAIAEATRAIASRPGGIFSDLSGVYHMTCAGKTTWCGFARRIFETPALLENRQPRVDAIGSEEYPMPARRPHNSVLSNARLHRTFQVTLPDWQAAFDAVSERMTAPAAY